MQHNWINIFTWYFWFISVYHFVIFITLDKRRRSNISRRNLKILQSVDSKLFWPTEAMCDDVPVSDLGPVSDSPPNLFVHVIVISQPPHLPQDGLLILHGVLTLFLGCRQQTQSPNQSGRHFQTNEESRLPSCPCPVQFGCLPQIIASSNLWRQCWGLWFNVINALGQRG